MQTKKGPISLNDVENEKIRDGFKDPRIHFAINCAAKSCPPIRTEPYAGEQITNSSTTRCGCSSTAPTASASRRTAASWSSMPPRSWTGSRTTSRSGAAAGSNSSPSYVTPDKRKQIDAAGNQVNLKFDDYDWKLNDASK